MKRVSSYNVIVHAVLIFCTLLCLLPFLLLVVSSFASEGSIMRYGYSFFPKEWSLNAYRYLFGQGGQLIHAYGISLFSTVLGTAMGLSFTVALAYALAQRDLPGRNLIMFFVFFTMLFNGGLVPSYIMWTTTFHIKNTIWALIFPNLLVKAFFVILARSYFQTNLPQEIQEAARIDGASELQIFFRIALPLAKPIVSTLLLFIGLSYWNDWNNGLIFLTDNKLYSIQNVLNEMIKTIQFLQQNASTASPVSLPSNGVRMAIAVVATLPVLIAYPFLQKGFVRGIVMGGVKGWGHPGHQWGLSPFM